MICKDYSVSGESFALTKCSNCDLVITNPRPSIDNISQYYQSENYVSHTNKGNNLVNRVYKLIRNITLRQKQKLIKSLSTENTLLDYGCGTGDFLSYCQSKNWVVAGVEPDEHARETAQHKVGKDLHSHLNEITKKERFGVITLWHVLEHVHDLNKTFKKLKSHLHDNGKMIVALPNCDSYDQQKYGTKWAAYDVPRHLYHFNKLTFNKLCEKHKMKITDIRPMYFDSFYVSLLSETNLTGNKNLIKSFITGWKSNRWAKDHDGNYSSLIYILENK